MTAPARPQATPAADTPKRPAARPQALAVLAGVDPRSALIVLQCSAGKAPGGSGPQPGPELWPHTLLQARARVLKTVAAHERHLLPAWRRYTGGFYTAAQQALADAVTDRAQLLVLSGGYGLLRATEPIGVYNRVFHLSDWPPGLLPALLAEEAARSPARAVVAIAGVTTGYAQLVRHTPWAGAGVQTALLVSVNGAGGGAMAKVPRGLGRAFAAFWQQQPDAYPPDLTVQRLT